MKALSQSEYGEIRSLYESMYAPNEVITEELIDEIIDELVEELISEGVDEEEAYSLVEEATDTYIDEAKVTFGSDTAPIRKSGAPVGARRRYGMRKAGDALQGAKKAAGSAYKTAKSKAAGAAVDVAVAGSMAKKKAGEVKKAAQEAPGKAKAAVTTAASDAKKKTKSGIKGFIKRQAQKVVSRMSEEKIEEDMKPLPKEKMERQSNKAYAKEVVAARQGNEKETNKQMQRRIAMTDPAGRKEVLRKEELEATGLFTAKEIEALVESENVDEAMSSYDKNRKRAAQRAADRNAARAAGKTGAVPGVGYVTPNKERETYTDEKGTVRHKSGAKNE